MDTCAGCRRVEEGFDIHCQNGHVCWMSTSRRTVWHTLLDTTGTTSVRQQQDTRYITSAYKKCIKTKRGHSTQQTQAHYTTEKEKERKNQMYVQQWKIPFTIDPLLV